MTPPDPAMMTSTSSASASALGSSIAASAESAPLVWEKSFDQLLNRLRQQLLGQEQFTLTLTAETSQFMRFNRAKIRQTGQVLDGNLFLTWIAGTKTSDRALPFTADVATDWPALQAAVKDLRQEIPQLPDDPYLVVPAGHGASRDVYPGQLLSPNAVADTLLPEVRGLDFAGLYAGGWAIRAYGDSAGQQHWFATETFTLDYSLFTEGGQAVKGTFAGGEWNTNAYSRQISGGKALLAKLERSPKPVPRGQYRTYLAPAAVADLITIFSRGGVSEAAIRHGGSAFAALSRGERQLSPRFALKENFIRGGVPRFNSLGEAAPDQLPIIREGRLVNSLVSSRTAKEYKIASNAAETYEGMRSPELSPGTLAQEESLQALDTGLYVSNLHYLNWSDRPQGRVTGMTRYACFWVEGGEIVAPIQNLRFDESLYHCFGDGLMALTNQVEFIPSVGTYGNRDLGGIWTPGALVENFTYTL
ncbi:MAG: metallopeptidase TldD-related protein [Cyanobacteria bacterium P01_D01_bin.115]